MWHFIDGPTFEVAFYKWARFDSKRSTKVCAAEEVYNWAPVEVSKMELVQSSQNCQKERERESRICNHKRKIKFKVQIKVFKYEVYRLTILSIKYTRQILKH